MAETSRTFAVNSGARGSSSTIPATKSRARCASAVEAASSIAIIVDA